MALEVGAGQAGEASGVEVCRSQAFAAKNSCYQAELEKIMLAEGTEKALAVLEEVTSDDPDALREAHTLVHHLGQRSFSHYGTAPLALSHCRDVFWSGCYHGVLQAYVSSLPTIEPQHILPL